MNETFVQARVKEMSRGSGDWIFVDIGFAQHGKRTCGLAFNEEVPFLVDFGDLATKIIEWMSNRDGPFYLLVEAPLSVAFDAGGNPTGRSIERRTENGKTISRYWYDSSGCRMMVAATYLLQQLQCRLDIRGFKGEVRLVEGFCSFKKPNEGGRSDHAKDVSELRAVAWRQGSSEGRIVQPQELKTKDCDVLVSAFAVSGMNFNVPPVVEVGEHPPTTR